MDPVTERHMIMDANRLAKIQEHLELGHRLDVEIDGQDILVYCSTGHAQQALFRLFPRAFPLPQDTCVVDGEPWQMRFRRSDTYLSLVRADFLER